MVAEGAVCDRCGSPAVEVGAFLGEPYVRCGDHI
jgi:hypothetical protein